MMTLLILTSNGKTAKLRHDITEANLLDTVVMLPANVFNKTSIAATIIYLKTGRKQGDPITFVDFSSFIEEKEDLDEEKDTIDIEWVKEAIDKTGYTCVSVSSEPYKKKGLFG